MKKEFVAFIGISLILVMAAPASAFSFTEFYESILDDVHDFITGKAGGASCTPIGNIVDCETGLEGVCSEGTKTCLGSGDYTECTPNIEVGELLEICSDGLDNDCNGRRDIWDSACYEQGTCNDGVQNQNEVCIDVGGICANEESSETLCSDGLDNDCNGQIDGSDNNCQTGQGCDPGSVNYCSTGLFGVCSSGTKTCDSSGFWQDCIQTTPPKTEICNDGLDNDCNGKIDNSDNNCPLEDGCSPDSIQSCSTGLFGACSSGTKTCDSSGYWQDCIQTTPPKTEICSDNLDNNCNGQTDESTCEKEELVVTSPIDCEITSVSWSKDVVDEDYLLKMKSKGDCEDAEIEIKIYEVDLLINDPLRTQFSTFNGVTANLLVSLSKEEVANVASGFLEGNEFELSFKAKVRYTNQRELKSNILKI